MKRTRKGASYIIGFVPLLIGAVWIAAAQADPSDFIPGEKTLFYDDFSDMVKGSPPPHWKVRGAKVDLVIEGESKGLRAEKSTNLYANLKGLPEDFTLETDLKIDLAPITYTATVTWLLGTESAAYLRLHLAVDNHQASVSVNTSESLGSDKIKLDLNKPVRLNLWLQKGRLRAYVNEERLIDANQVHLKKLEIARLALNPQPPVKGTPAITLARVRIAESTPDFSQVIQSTGRYASHGIHFDVDSDRLQPESAPVLKMIADGLVATPTLKVRIEGHTDNTGDAQHNTELSKRRAESVKNALISDFKIDTARLTTEGLGSTKPLDSNDTPTGRANNRRVEFVKQ